MLQNDKNELDLGLCICEINVQVIPASFTKKSHHALALPGLVQCLLCLSNGFPSSALYCTGGISQNASGINSGHFVSVRRSGDFGHVRKTANWGEVCEDLSFKKNVCCGARAR